MNYEETLEYIDSLTPTKFNPGLGRFAAFMHEHGNPQDSYKSFHVTGTNGKGTTVAILESILRHSGFKTGRYIGPHLLHWNERFAVNGKSIANDDMARIGTDVRARSEAFAQKFPQFGSLTWFEYLTAIGFFYFAQEHVDYAVIEVGLGGLWDATNVLSKPSACGIVSIGLDHTHILGETIEQIAEEKAGIIKPCVPVVTAAEGAALPIISAKAQQLDAPLVQITGDRPLITGTTFGAADAGSKERDLEDFVSRTMLFKAATTEAKARYQRRNACVALAMIWAAGLADRQLQEHVSAASAGAGIESFFLPGRFQYFADHNLLVDGAHNPPGAASLRDALDEKFGEQPRTYILAFFESKDVQSFIRNLLRPGDHVIAAQAKGRRATITPETIADAAKALDCTAETAPSLESAFQAACKRADRNMLVATGSFETVKAAFLHLGFSDVDTTEKSC